MNNLISICSAIALTLFSCTPQPEYAELNGLTQGTTYHIVVEKTPGLDIMALRQEIELLFTEIDNSLSIYNDSSVISAINANRSNLTDTLFREVFRASSQISSESGGLFDITIGPLVKAWGFGPDAIKRFDESMLDSLLALVGMDKVRLEGDRIIKADPDMFIDVNAIAQGYTVDLVADLIVRSGITHCLVEVGGEVRTVGDKHGMGWKVGIDTPADGNYVPGADIQARIRLDNLALATSGNYRKFFVEDGIKYSHTIDPRTGYPVRHTLLSATLIAPTGAEADAWATACMVGGKDEAIAFIEKYDFLEGYLIYSDEDGIMKSWISEGLREMIISEK
ncbi:MAG TPA: FAD:protein FMN transferase [Bacteroidales bacterium]|nr:FAD:protein FMN transferase [Bacteroidales bacterium]